jgi:hypothetical protein
MHPGHSVSASNLKFSQMKPYFGSYTPTNSGFSRFMTRRDGVTRRRHAEKGTVGVVQASATARKVHPKAFHRAASGADSLGLIRHWLLSMQTIQEDDNRTMNPHKTGLLQHGPVNPHAHPPGMHLP